MTSAPKFMPELILVADRPHVANDWRSSYAIALPVIFAESPIFPHSHFAQLVEKEIGQSITDLASQWPEITGKAGELTEIAIKHSSIKRIYLIGVGAESADDLRKAGASLARKVKVSEKTITSALASNKSVATSHFISLILASYIWSEKTKSATQATRFLIVGNFENELKRAITLATGVWRARDLIHTPSNVKTPLWLANQVKGWVTSAKNPALSISIKSGKELEDFGGLRAVGGSSPKPGPRLVEIS
ncbi:MAG: leucyl aminopeptidase family protein, partial [Actinobacteria bacterium]|nr:leucyl aminopeptidase family protein [Actinomycetota bacterium]